MAVLHRLARYIAVPPGTAYLELGIARFPGIGSQVVGTEYTLSAMQKLFSMFPSGAPGLALLLLRLFVSALLVSDAVTAVSALDVVLVCVLVACALAVVVGFATPIAAVLAALIETIGLNAHFIQITLHSFAPIVIGVALALLGPGAYSLDARVFGRRRVMEFGPGVNDDG